jgi:hypothetical protein
MTDREKLISLIKNIQDYGVRNEYGVSYVCQLTLSPEEIVDHLIAHGVTVMEPQKPMDLVDAIEADDPVWIEYVHTFMDMEVIKIYTVDYFESRFFVDGTLIGERIKEKSMLLKKDDYGKTWRCWAEKPTEEERKAAPWE